MRDRFIGVLSHELRTPITSIYGGAQVLARREMELDNRTRAELLHDLADESGRLRRLHREPARPGEGRRGADFFGPRPILVNRVLNDVVARERSMWPGATIDIAAIEPIPVVSGDEDHLSQIMRNLLANAMKKASAS